MKKNLFLLFISLLILKPNITAMQKNISESNVEKPSEITKLEENKQTNEERNRNLIIMYDSKINKEEFLKTVKEYGAELIYQYNIINGVAIRIPEEKMLDEAISFFKNVKGVISVKKDKAVTLD